MADLTVETALPIPETVEIHRNAAAVPETPSGGTYNRSTGTLTPPAGWTAEPTDPAPGELAFAAQHAINPAQTGQIAPEWSAPYEPHRAPVPEIPWTRLALAAGTTYRLLFTGENRARLRFAVTDDATEPTTTGAPLHPGDALDFAAAADRIGWARATHRGHVTATPTA